MFNPLSSFLWVLALLAINFFIGAMMLAENFEWSGDRYDESAKPSGDLYDWLETHDDWMLLVITEIWPIVLLAYYIEKKKKKGST